MEDSTTYITINVILRYNNNIKIYCFHSKTFVEDGTEFSNHKKRFTMDAINFYDIIIL